jgi:hypothetical protein
LLANFEKKKNILFTCIVLLVYGVADRRRSTVILQVAAALFD